MRKKLALLLALSILPTLSLASYEPNASQWNWYQSTEKTGYFISKEPVYKLSETDNTLILRGYVQTVYATPRNNAKFAIYNVKVTYNFATGERRMQMLSTGKFTENKDTVSFSDKPEREVNVPAGTNFWRISQMLLDTYNAQQITTK